MDYAATDLIDGVFVGYDADGVRLVNNRETALTPQQAREIAEALMRAAKAFEDGKKKREWRRGRGSHRQKYVVDGRVMGMIEPTRDYEWLAMLATKKAYCIGLGWYANDDAAREAVEKAVADGIEIND